MIDESKYKVHSAIQSSGGDGTYAVKILVYRPDEAQKRFDALCAKDYADSTAVDHAIEREVPSAERILRAVQRQDRMLDPAIKQSEKDTKAEILKAFGQASIYAEAIPNGYHRPDDVYAVGNPWYRITTTVGHFVVGWRRSVIHLDWKETTLRSRVHTSGFRPSPSGQEVFPNEDVTRWETGIHAWGHAKLAEYVQTLMTWPTRHDQL